mgnify:CR=1 FL=1
MGHSLNIVDKNKKIFLFASELKALFNFQGFEKQISPMGLSQLFINGFSEGSLSIYEKVNKLEAGNFLKFNIRNFTISQKIHQTIYFLHLLHFHLTSTFLQRSNLPWNNRHH